MIKNYFSFTCRAGEQEEVAQTAQVRGKKHALVRESSY